MTQLLTERGVENRFIDGLRVTSPEVIDALLQAVAGSVNHHLLASLSAAGGRAVGLSGLDAGLAEAEQLRPELGAVGRIIRCDPALFNLLCDAAYLPVVACLAGDREGRIYNVNADLMAVACAAAFAADKLLFCTDVAGVRGEDGMTLPVVTPASARELIDRGIATGGMQAKVTAALDALAAGIGEVVIVPGADADILPRVLAGAAVGTRFHARRSN